MLWAKCKVYECRDSDNSNNNGDDDNLKDTKSHTQSALHIIWKVLINFYFYEAIGIILVNKDF